MEAGSTVRYQGVKWTLVRRPTGQVAVLKRRVGRAWAVTSAPVVKLRVA